MKFFLPATLLVVSVVVTGPASALDCAKASTRLEKRICADKELKAADAAMGVAYLKVLRLATDPDIRSALIDSQRRWIAARESELGDLRADAEAGAGTDEETEADAETEAADPRRIVLDATTARTEEFAAKVDGKPRFIVEALKQRAGVAPYSGGPFSGYDVRCSFIPDRGNRNIYSYQCFGARSVQDGDRVCTEEQDFATWTMAGRRAVADIVDGKPKVVASCALNSGNDSACPDMEGGGGDAARWNLAPTPEQARIGDGSARLGKLAPELGYIEDDQGWLKPCLTDKSFPAADPAANRSPAR